MTQMCLAFCHIDVLISFQSADGLTPVDTNLPQIVLAAGAPTKIGPNFQSNISKILKIQLGGMDMG